MQAMKDRGQFSGSATENKSKDNTECLYFAEKLGRNTSSNFRPVKNATTDMNRSAP